MQIRRKDLAPRVISSLLPLGVSLILSAFPGAAFAHGEQEGESREQPLSIEEKQARIAEETIASIRDEYTRKVEPIFRHACFDCHSDRTSYPWYYRLPGIRQWIDRDIREAREHLDMSDGFPFRSKHGIAHDLEEIQDEIEARSMPPKSYIFMHDDAELSEDDRGRVLEWVQRSRKTLEESVAVGQP